MSFQTLAVALLVAVVAVSAFQVARTNNLIVKNTKLFEDFKIGGEPVIVSARELFTEKQLREFTATYSVDERQSIFDLIGGIFSGLSGGGSKAEKGPSGSSIASSLKSTVSLAVLEEKTAVFVQGKSDAKSFYKVLQAAFGKSLPTVLPEILASLPANKAKDLSKIAK